MSDIAVNMEILSQRLLLRPLAFGDAEVILSLNVGNVRRYFYPFNTLEEMQTWISEQLVLITEKQKVEFAILERESGEFLGLISLRNLQSGNLELALWIRENRQKEGFGKEVILAVLSWAKENLKWQKFVYECESDNWVSQKLAVSCGFSKIKTYLTATKEIVSFEINKEVEIISSNQRFQFTESGVSPRWLPGSLNNQGQPNPIYFANGDEHDEAGIVDESATNARKMIEKRMRKLETILQNLFQPELFGVENNADISFVGWGSSKNVVLDAIDLLENKTKINYLHFDYLWPLKTEKLKNFFAQNKHICLIEGNYQGQLGQLIRQQTGLEFQDKLLKWDGRQIYLEELLDFIQEKLELTECYRFVAN